MQGEQGLRRTIVQICRLMYERGYIASADGNVSARVGKDRFLCTPSGVHKGFLNSSDLVAVNLEGAARGPGRPTSEWAMHREIYRARSTVNCVIHAHPPYTVACTVAGVSLTPHLIPEAIFSLGSIRHAGYATPTTDEVAQRISERILDRDALVLDRHGTVTVGEDLQGAFNLLEAVEHTAKIGHLARCLGPVEPLPAGEVDRICGLAGRDDCS